MFIVVIGLLLISSCTKTKAEGPIISKVLDIDNFSGVDMVGAENVMITYGTEQKIVAIGNENVVNAINRSVSYGIWKMKLNEDFTAYSLRYEIAVPRLSLIMISGSGEIVSKGFSND